MEGLLGGWRGSPRTGRLRTACEGCESQGNWLGLHLGDNRESLKVPGDGIKQDQETLISEDLSGQPLVKQVKEARQASKYDINRPLTAWGLRGRDT